MLNHIKKHLAIYLLCVPFLIFSVFLPDTSITMTGGFAWAYMYCCTFIGFTLIWIGIFGGEISYSSKGIKGWIKDFKTEKKQMNEEIEKVREEIIKVAPQYAVTLMQFGVLSDRRIKKLIKNMKKSKRN
ncbi:hypothetical protein BSK59_13730 [Paenibacillus odorifer]|uniref:hypothetical protein n=1 Tax=Paenibacillus odorifer TaxID=189426 RepID=UPI00096FFDAE|nr:hypothetical protein [Paenibacillus odorifer]OME55531.1 hypothetical protein BSK59_13730 [Paenibacillus odorifer]